MPVGVGSLAQAAVAHYRSSGAARRGTAALLSVEPDTAACVLRSLADGALASVPTAATVMNGLNCGTPSSIAWPYLRDGLDAAIAVTDADAREAVAALSIGRGRRRAVRRGRVRRPAGGAHRRGRGRAPP